MDRSLQLSLAEMQAKLFEMSGKLGYDSEKFIKAFMNSDIAKGLDSEFDFMQWAGKEYIMERIQDELPKATVKGEGDKIFHPEVLYWAGYTYRQWHFLTGETSKEIYKQANATAMNTNYYGYHTVDVSVAVDWFKEKKRK